MGIATSSTSLLGGASRIGAYIQQRTTAPFPFGACSSTPSPLLCSSWRGVVLGGGEGLLTSASSDQMFTQPQARPVSHPPDS